MRDSYVALQPLSNEHSGSYLPALHRTLSSEGSLDGDDGIDTFNDSRRHSQRSVRNKISLHRTSASRALWRLALLVPFLAFAAFGVIHLLEALIGRSRALWNLHDYDLSKVNWSVMCSSRPKDVTPIPCHSHNDYARASPLFEALRWGCTSVEADIYRSEEDLLVGHDRGQLHPNSTLETIYLIPLKQLLDDRNRPSPFTDGSTYGLFEADPDQTLVLLIDFKQADSVAFHLMKQQLQPLRDYMSFWDGEKMNLRPITVVCSGAAPFEEIANESSSSHRDIFYDAPLHALTDAYSVGNSFYASTNFRASVGQVWLGHLLPPQSATIREQIRRAKAAGLKARYWSTPAWPVSLRNHVWHVLMKEGADVLNVDDLRAAAALYW